MNIIGLWEDKVLGLIFLYTYGILLGVVEGKYLVSFIGYFDVTRDDVGNPCVGLTIRDITTASYISHMYLKKYLTV